MVEATDVGYGNSDDDSPILTQPLSVISRLDTFRSLITRFRRLKSQLPNYCHLSAHVQSITLKSIFLTYLFHLFKLSGVGWSINTFMSFLMIFGGY